MEVHQSMCVCSLDFNQIIFFTAAIDRLARPKALTTEPETHKVHVAVPGKKKPVGDAPPGRQINKNELCK